MGDPGLDDVYFEATLFEGWIVDICSFPPELASKFFGNSARYRSAPIQAQLLYAEQILGERALGERIQRQAADALSAGPLPLTAAESADLRWDLTMLLTDLRHVPDNGLVSLAALCHSQFGLAMLDASGNWRADRKSLSRSLDSHDADFKRRLDEALTSACNGERDLLIGIGEDVLAKLGGPQRTYERFGADLNKPDL